MPLTYHSHGIFVVPRLKTYTTNFPLTENPISEGGVWVKNGLTPGTVLTAPATNGTLAYSTQPTPWDTYNDSIAVLSGFKNNSHYCQGTMHIANQGSRNAGTNSHEIELLLCYDITAANGGQVFGYECNFGYAGASSFYSQIFRLDGGPIHPASGLGYLEIDGGASFPDPVDGDIFKAEYILATHTINTYLIHNGVSTLVQTAVDATYTGQPGIGFFWRGTEAATDWAFSSYTAGDL